MNDETRDGADIQRSFVKKALQTNDFAILEGPPGSGKTTVILELIAQIIQRGQKVLLCGSTHVAIDNVLERLEQKDLMKKCNIFPIRVGHEGSVGEEVAEYRLGDFKRDYKGSLLERYDVYDDYNEESQKRDGKIGLSLFMEIANLVCGTTLGILQYPLFKKQFSKKKSSRVIIPEFDYLIIDESSKTTFQEFLVPALYAKKWILVGDTRQLSPFVDANELTYNLQR